MTKLQDARVTAGSIFVTLSEFGEQTFERGDARGTFRSQLTALAGQRSDRSVSGMEEPGRLAAQMQSLSF